MFNTKRKRAVVLALIAFFCGATAYVAVDWKRFGGGFLALLRHAGEPIVVHAGGRSPSGGAVQTALGGSHPNSASLPRLAPSTARRHATGFAGGSGGHPSDDDLFKYGDPAAGGIPAGSFVVAQNDTPAGGGVEGGAATESSAAPTGGDAGGGGVTSPAPAPSDTNGGIGDGGIITKTPTPAPSPSGGTPVPSTPTPPAPTPPSPAPTPAAPAPSPTQSGTSDQNPGSPGGDTPPVPPTPPVSAVPEASSAAMMGLGALFLAVAATRRRKNAQD